MEILAIDGDARELEFAEVYQNPPAAPPPSEHWQFERCLSNRLYEHGIDTDGLDDPRNALEVAFDAKLDYEKMECRRTSSGGKRVVIGLPIAVWEKTADRFRRRLLAEMTLLGLAACCDVPQAQIEAVRSLYQEEEAFTDSRDCHALSIDGKALAALDMHRWSVLSTEEQAEVCHAVSKALVSIGSRFHPWERSEVYGAPKHSATFAATDAATGLRFALVPGGELRSDAAAREAAELASAESERAEFDREGRATARTGPFLLAEEVLMSDRQSICAQAGASPIVIPYPGGIQCDRQPLCFRWRDAARLLRHFRWSLMSCQEFEWAARGGSSATYYWGEESPLESEPSGSSRLRSRFRTLVEYASPAERRRTFPQWNQFGLRKMLSYKTWCEPVQGDAVRPLCTIGGAASAWPWQSPSETAFLLPHSVGRYCLDDRPVACVRPMLPLAAE